MEEILDVLDRNGLKTGRTETRQEIHRQGLWHRIAAAVVMDYSGHILLQCRSRQKLTNPGKWDTAAAGHVDAGEDSMTAVIRELAEEVGIEIGLDAKVADFQYLLCYCKGKQEIVSNEVRIDHQFCDNFLIRVPEIRLDQLKLQESEVSDVKLVTLDELKDLVASGTMVDRRPVYDEIFRRFSTGPDRL